MKTAITTSIDVKLISKIASEAERRKVPVSTIVSEALESYLGEHVDSGRDERSQNDRARNRR